MSNVDIAKASDVATMGRDRGSGTTPPATGNRRGDIYLHGVVLLMWNGTAWQAISGKPAAKYLTAIGAVQSVTASTTATLKFALPDYTHPEITPNGTFDTFTVARAGIYLLETQARLAANLSGNRNQISLSGPVSTIVYGAQTMLNGTSAVFDMNLSVIAKLPANEQIQSSFFSTTPTTLDTSSGQQYRTHLSITMLQS